MSLQVWLPLNGNLNNQGLSDLSFSILSSNTVLADSGKIGKTYSNNSFTNGGLVSNKQINLGTKQSMFCWMKFSSLNSGSSLGGGLVSQHRYANNTGMGITIKYVSSTTGYISVNTGTGSARTYNTYCGKTLLQANTWYHVGYTYDGSNIRLYVNGILEATHAFTGMSVPSDYISVYCWSMENSTIDSAVHTNYRFNGAINDVRLYDHCLSAKEIKEISKGLVLHYKLDNIYNTNPNKYGQPYCDGYMNSGFTRTELSNERGYNYKLTYVGTGDNSWKSLSVPTYSFTAGKKYFYSVKIRCNKWTGDGLWLRASRSSNDWVTNTVAVCGPTLADGKWHEYYVSQTVNTTYDRSGSTVTSAPLLEFYTGACATKDFTYDFDFDIKDLQVVESDNYVPFQEGGWNTTVVDDCSGYGYDGTKSGVFGSDSTSPRYDTSITFPNGTDYAKSTFTNTMNEFTFSYWIKPSASNGGYSIVGSNYGNDAQCWFAVNTENSGVWFYTGQYANVSGLLTNGTWYHCVFTFKNGTSKWYINGVEKTLSRNTVTKTSIPFNNFTIGNSYTGSSWNCKNYGSISDVRIYATALSASDIKELYQTSASIDKNGNMYCYELKEG